MKQALTEALALDRFGHGGDRTFKNWEAVHTAARLVKRLLPGECDNCFGDGREHDHDWTVLNMACLVCHGSGQVWDEGIVEAVAKAVQAEGGWHNDHRTVITLPSSDMPDSFFERIARAVLSALVELLTEKVET